MNVRRSLAYDNPRRVVFDGSALCEHFYRISSSWCHTRPFVRECVAPSLDHAPFANRPSLRPSVTRQPLSSCAYALLCEHLVLQ